MMTAFEFTATKTYKGFVIAGTIDEADALIGEFLKGNKDEKVVIDSVARKIDRLVDLAAGAAREL